MKKGTQNVILAWLLIGLVLLVMYGSMSYIWTAFTAANSG
jgi:hypothetical protein